MILKKIYIWNDLPLLYNKKTIKHVDKELEKLEKKYKQISIIKNDFISVFIEKTNNLDSVVTIGTRPSYLVDKTKIKYKIKSKRNISRTGFAESSEISFDKEISKEKSINVVEDIVVTGTTMEKVLEKLYKKGVSINLYLLIGYDNVIKKLLKEYPNINIYCFKILPEKSVTESTCIFLSDLLYGKLGNTTYIKHILNSKVLEDNTNMFINDVLRLKKKIKKSIGVVTITLGINYGNRLQNYALQEVLKSYEYKVNTFHNIYQEKDKEQQKRRKRILKEKNKKYRKKLNKFKEFNKKYITMKGTVKSFYVSNRLKNKYDYFVCGSDQIWNPNYIGNNGPNFLTFASEKQRICYAPSFGSDVVPKDRIEEYRGYLNGFNRLSCREINGSEMIKEYYKLNCKTVLDPTLLLKSSDWDKISKKPNFNISKDYVLAYFLSKKSKDYQKCIEKISERDNLNIIDLTDEINKKMFNTGPSEFIYLIKNAKLICTDSYHGMVFSIIFQKPYITFERLDDNNNMNSRFSSLIELLDLPDRNYRNVKNIYDINYSKISNKIEELRMSSLEYLEELLR